MEAKKSRNIWRMSATEAAMVVMNVGCKAGSKVNAASNCARPCGPGWKAPRFYPLTAHRQRVMDGCRQALCNGRL